MEDRLLFRINHIYLLQVALALVIAAAFTAGTYFARPAAIATCDPTRDVFFVRQIRTPGTPVPSVTFFKIQPNRESGDIELGTIEGNYVDPYYLDRKGRIFLFPIDDGARQSLYVYSICDGKLQKALDLPEADRTVISALYVDDGNTLLVTTKDGAPAELNTNSRLEVYYRGKRSTVAEVSKESPLYASVAIAGATADGSVVYLNEAGGDAGDWWGTYYRWDKTTNSVRKLGDFTVTEEKGHSGYFLGALNPSATLAMRVRRATYAPDDLEPSQSSSRTCLNKRAYDGGKYDSIGDEVLVRDISTQEERVVYKSLVGVRNLCKNHLRVITAPRWRDDQTIVFSMPYGIFEIDVRSGHTRLVASNEDPWRDMDVDSSLKVIGANDDYLLTGRATVVHIRTGREISVPALRRNWEGTNTDVVNRFVIPSWTAGDF